MIIQLNPQIPISTPKGEGLAWAVIDYGIEHDLYWICAINETGEIWTYSNKEVRALKNITLGRIIMAEKKKWIQDAIKKPGSLRKALHVKEGKTIPEKKLAAAAKKGGKIGQKARLAETLKKLPKHHGKKK